MKMMRKAFRTLGVSQKDPKNSTNWLFGDINLPDFDWPNENIKIPCKSQTMYDYFLENLTNFRFEQIVKIPTQGDNI